MLLCKRLVAILLSYARQMGAEQPHTLQEQLPASNVTSHRWILNMLPKGKRMKPLVSEFQGYKLFAIDSVSDPEKTAIFENLPKGAPIVQRRLQWGKIRVDEHACWWLSGDKSLEIDRGSPLLEKKDTEDEIHVELVTVGIPRSPWDFLERAISAGHPRTLAIHLNEVVTKMLHENFAEEPYQVVKTRALFLRKWTQRCRDLTADEQVLHQGLDPHLQHVLQGKRLLLFKEMLQELQYPDTELVDTICSGFPLTGWLPKSNVFPA